MSTGEGSLISREPTQEATAASPSEDQYLTTLLLEARDGNQWSLATFVRRSQPSITRLLLYIGVPGEHHDLVQETYLRALKSLPRYRGDAPAQAWLFAIARRVAADSIRRRDRGGRLSKALRDRPVADHPAFETGQSELQEMLERLKPDRRDAFVMTQLLGFSYNEAADMSGCAVGTVRSRVARAREELINGWLHE